MKNRILLLIAFVLAACMNPPLVTATPVVLTNTPIAPTVPPDDALYLPNPAWQPGAYNPDVTQDTIQTTICVSG